MRATSLMQSASAPEHTDIVIPDFAGPMHGANEGTPFEKLIEALKIYILALLRLQEIDL